VRSLLAGDGIDFRTRKDHVIFERDELLTAAGTPFSVFTPYKNAWLKRLSAGDLEAHEVTAYSSRLAAPGPRRRGVPELSALGFAPTNARAHLAPGARGAEALLRDFLTRIDRYASQGVTSTSIGNGPRSPANEAFE